MNVTSRGTAHPFHRAVRARLAGALARLCLLTGLVLAMMSGAIAQAQSLSAAPVDAQAMVAAHNAVRAQVGQSALAWSQDMVAAAEGWARQLEANPPWCKAVIHNAYRPERTGENMHAAMVNSPADATAPEEIVGAWAAEGQYYTVETHTCAAGKECAHYVQVVWGETTELGCAAALCPEEGGLKRVTICNYRPGLLIGQPPY